MNVTRENNIVVRGLDWFGNSCWYGKNIIILKLFAISYDLLGAIIGLITGLEVYELINKMLWTPTR